MIFNLAYYAWTSSANEGRLNVVSEVYFPILEDTDHAIAALEDLDPALRDAVGDITVLEDAQEFVWIINERLDSIVTTDPTQSGPTEELRPAQPCLEGALSRRSCARWQPGCGR